MPRRCFTSSYQRKIAQKEGMESEIKITQRPLNEFYFRKIDNAYGEGGEIVQQTYT